MTSSAAIAGTTVAESVSRASAILKECSDSPRLDAEMLMAEVLGRGRAAVIADSNEPLATGQLEAFESFVTRRRHGEPVAYILGSKEFYSLTLAVNSEVLVPRPETELLVDAALARIPSKRASVLDLGTGSGAIALALKRQRPDIEITGVDREHSALVTAGFNAASLGLPIEWIPSDWFSALTGRSFDLIVSNPPYVEGQDAAFAGELAFEPRRALDGGIDGLNAFREILPAAGRYLRRGGQLLFEHGFDQQAALIALAEPQGFIVDECLADFAGLPRVLCLRLGTS